MIDAYKCCGCGACENVCGKNAISLSFDEYGFLRPKTDDSLCVDCGLCSKICPEQNDAPFKKERAVYALKAQKKTRELSQSGGAFTLLAEKILENGGVVYGVGLDENLTARYFRAEAQEKLSILKGSKYVQADNRGSYKAVYTDLKNGKTVLYSGTPCFVGGLYRYLEFKKCKADNLYTADLVCHGVPSPKIFEDYLVCEQKTAGKTAMGFVFRDKKWSLNEKYSKIIWNDKTETLTNGYLRIFASRNAHRDTCATCKYALSVRVGDITLGDFWGIEKLNPAFDDNKGVSLCIANSKKGEALLNSVLGKTRYLPFSINEAVLKQPSMQNPQGAAPRRDDFWKAYHADGFENATVLFCDYGTALRVKLKNGHIKTFNKKFLYSHLRGKIKTSIPPFLRKFARKINEHLSH